MASMPKVFNQRKKTQNEIESEQFEKNQYTHIGKAINSTEGAPKEKHIRVIILGTFHYAGASIFYKHVSTHQLQANPIACWKFLYVVHKIMRDGHEQAMKDVMRNERYIRELKDLWKHMKAGYGNIISSFCRLLQHKMKFHRIYPQVPGNLVLNNEDLLTGSKSNDELFDLCLDLLNYLEELCNFQQAVLNSLDKSKSNSMTPQGQCRLTPLIQVIQDTATLYDLCVRLLFRLHAKLDVELLSGHRQRFTKLFQITKTFFQQAQTFQYFKTLIQVPTLPDQPPNFFVESDLVAQKALVVNVNEDDDDANNLPASPEKSSTALIELDQTRNNREDDSRFNDLFGKMDAFNFSENERSQMQQEIDYLKNLIEKIKAEYSERVNSLLARIRVLEEEVKGLVQLKDQYEERLREYENHKCDTVNADKFNKIKDAYTKLREEHVKILRLQGDCKQELEKKTKEIQKMEQKIQEQEEAYAVLEKRNLMQSTHEKDMDECRRELVDAQSQLKAYERTKFEQMAKCKNLEADNKQLQSKIQELRQELTETSDSSKNALDKLEGELHTLQQTVTQLQSVNQQLTKKAELLENQLNSEKSTNQQLTLLRNNLIGCACEANQKLIRDTYQELINNDGYNNCKISIDAIMGSIDKVIVELGTINNKISSQSSGLPQVQLELSTGISQFGHHMSSCMLGTRLLASDPDNGAGDVLARLGELHEVSVGLLESIRVGEDNLVWSSKLEQVLETVRALARFRCQDDGDKDGDGSDLFEEELRRTRNAVDMAEARFKMIVEESRQKYSGKELEVNERILEACSELMFAIKQLIEKSRHVQTDIIRQGKGSGSVKEFYKRHHKWTEGLISAAKAVGAGAVSLCESSDNLVSKNGGKFEELIVCSREITASTTQLVVSSRVKADPNSSNLSQLLQASKLVSDATGKVIAHSKSAVNILEDEKGYDFSSLSLTQARRIEMETQVKVLELESDLVKERKKLGEIRKMHYQLSGEVIDEEFLIEIDEMIDDTELC